MTENTSFLDDDFGEWLESLLIEYHIPGMSVAVVDGDSVEAAGYGMARLPNQAATADTIWAMASTTKAITAVLLGLVIDEYNTDKKPSSKISYTSRVSKVLQDEFVLEDPYLTANLTFDDLLSHRSGLPSFNMNLGDRHGVSDLASVVQGLRYLGSPAHPLRTTWVYNNTGYTIIGRLVERLTGKPFKEVLQEKILNPLKMQVTFAGVEAVADAIRAGKINASALARGYAWDGKDNKSGKESSDKSSDEANQRADSGCHIPERYTDIKGSGPAGDLFSSVRDYASWAQALLKSAAAAAAASSQSKASTSAESVKSEAKNTELISPQIWTEVTTPRILMVPVQEHMEDFQKTPPNSHMTPRTYALGWHTDPFMYPDIFKVEHGGGMPGFGSGVMLVPGLQLGIIMASNSMEIGPKVWQGLKKEIIGKKLGLSKDERRKRTEKASAPADAATIEQQNSTFPDPGQLPADQVDTKEETTSSQIKVATRKDDGMEANNNDKSSNLVLQLNNDDVDLGSHYHHPALGTLKFRLLDDASAGLNSLDPNIDGNKIRRGDKPSTKDDKKSLKSNAGVIQASTVDNRALDLSWLLHFRGVPVEESKRGRQHMLVYDLEELLRRGDRSHDPLEHFSVAGEALGDRDRASLGGGPQANNSNNDEKYPVRDEIIWTRFRMMKNSGIVVLRELNKDIHPKGARYEVESIGMSPAIYEMFEIPEVDSSERLRLAPEWEQKISWFHRVSI